MVATICSVTCGGETGEDIEIYGKHDGLIISYRSVDKGHGKIEIREMMNISESVGS